MYLPEKFAETNVQTQHALMQANPLATVVIAGEGGLDANHLPLHLDKNAGPYGVLRGHIARANPLAAAAGTARDVLTIFHGPNAYITPSWYPSKAETGRVVPTWNYVVVHAHGRMRLVEDATWLRIHLEQLTASHEAAFDAPWQVSDAPAQFIEQLMGTIIGVEIVISRITGKWKTSQNQPSKNQAGVIAGLRSVGTAGAGEMAALVEAAGCATAS
jgi:transcriptional regulator